MINTQLAEANKFPRLMIQWLISLKENLCSNLLPINCKFKEGKTLSDLEKLGSNILIMGTNQLRKDLAYLQCSCAPVIHGHKCLIMATCQPSVLSNTHERWIEGLTRMGNIGKLLGTVLHQIEIYPRSLIFWHYNILKLLSLFFKIQV